MCRQFYHLLFLCILTNGQLLQAHVDLDYPVGGEIFSPGGSVSIQWTETVPHNTENWDLFYSSDGGVTWDTIMLDIPYAILSHNWTVPAEMTNEGMIRVIQDNPGQDYESTSGSFSVETFLPVTLSGFQLSQPTSGMVLIEWKTLSEVDNEWFAIERSTDEKDFIAIKKLAGSGYSTKLHSYQYLDWLHKRGQYYYRIKSISGSEEIEYSEIKSIAMESTAAQIQPNPTSGDIWFTDHQESIWQIKDLAGQNMQEVDCRSYQDEPCKVSVSLLPSGSYFLRKIGAQGQTYLFMKL